MTSVPFADVLRVPLVQVLITPRRARAARRRCRAAAASDPSRGSAAATARMFEWRRGGQRRPVRLALEDGRDGVGDRLARERAPARQHFVQHAAERPDVGALVDRLPRACSGLMYAAVPRIMPSRVPPMVIVGECDSVGRPAPSRDVAFASPKSSTLTVPSGRDLDVGGLQIAMDDPLARAPPRAPRRSAARWAARLVERHRRRGRCARPASRLRPVRAPARADAVRAPRGRRSRRCGDG